MRVVQMTLEEDLVEAVDRAVKRLKTSRSAFARIALSEQLKRLKTLELERRHRAGYAEKPVHPGEFGGGETDEAWPEW